MRKIRLDRDLWLFHGVADSPLVRHELLRAHLAEGLGLAPSELVLAREDQGKPILVSPTVPLWFNLASRDGVAVIATSHQGPVGVDVETLAHCQDVQGVAEHLFSSAEAHWLAERPESVRPLGFARLWTGKEAVLKAQGQGILQGLAEPVLAPCSEDGPPWPPVVAKLRGTPYTVTWYSSTVDEALIITARAQAEPC